MSLHMLGALSAKDAGPMVAQTGTLASTIIEKATAGDKKPAETKPEEKKPAAEPSVFDWFTQNTVISAVPNYATVGGGVVVAGGLIYAIKRFFFR